MSSSDQAFDGATTRLPLVARLLAHAASGAPFELDLWQSARPVEAERQFQWLMAGGLGPLLHHASHAGLDRLPTAWRDALLSADLTARVRHGNVLDSMLEMIDIGARLRLPLTLLKGISVSEEFYPSEHLRPMADIDVLLPAEGAAAFEAALLERGYIRLPYPAQPGHHHGAPLRHPQRHTIVEPHTRLFPEDSELRGNRAFSRANIEACTVESRYHGRPVRRLAAELQMAYIAASWFNDLTHRKVEPSFIASAFDAVYLLKSRMLDWNGLLEWLDNPMAQASLYVMATYLPRFGVTPWPRPVLARLAVAQGLVGPLQLRLIHAMLDRHLIGGRRWRLALPPPMPGRYSLLHQFDKRVLQPLRRRVPA
jgi:hypothetical protein